MPTLPFPELSPAFVARFWDRVGSPTGPKGCREWTRSKSKNGYGSQTIGSRVFKAHRIAYFLTFGPPPADKPFVLHECNNRACCNPDHLRAGTHLDNMNDFFVSIALAGKTEEWWDEKLEKLSAYFTK